MCKERIDVIPRVCRRDCGRFHEFNHGKRPPGHGSNPRLSEYDVRIWKSLNVTAGPIKKKVLTFVANERTRTYTVVGQMDCVV